MILSSTQIHMNHFYSKITHFSVFFSMDLISFAMNKKHYQNTFEWWSAKTSETKKKLSFLYQTDMLQDSFTTFFPSWFVVITSLLGCFRSCMWFAALQRLEALQQTHISPLCSNLDWNRHSGETAQPSKKGWFLFWFPGITIKFKLDATGLVIVVY